MSSRAAGRSKGRVEPFGNRSGETMEQHVAASPHGDEQLPIAKDIAIEEPHFMSLADLYRALREGDQPRPGFSDRIVPGRGPDRAPLFLLGEQPGDQEDRAEQTFVGPAGQMLDQCLLEAEIDPATTFQTNAVKRFKYLPSGKRRLHQTPNAGDIAHYRWWVGQEIRLVDPAVIVTLGLSALHALLGTRRPLKSVRGRLWCWNERTLVATIHPSYLLRLRPEDDYAMQRERFVADLRMAAKAAF